MSVFAVGFSGPLIGLYANNETPDPEVIKYGTIRLTIICSTYFLCGVMDSLSFSVRGIGHSTVSMVVSLIGACAFRVIWIYTVFAADRSLQTLYLSYPISWALTAAAHLICFIILFRREKNRLLKYKEIPV
jgi:Na+-driven multidrug efflux pump